MDTKEQKVVVIGGTSGIGLATARLLSKTYKVIIVGRSQKRLETALTELGGDCIGYVADAANDKQINDVFAQCGTVQHVVLAAANHGGVMPFTSITDKEMSVSIDGKLRPQIHAAQAALKVLAPSGSLTFVSAITALAPMAGASLLATVNGAIAAMVPALALEVAPIRVNAVLPGVIDTEWWDWLPEETRKAVFENTTKTLPVRRIGHADDVAEAITYLVTNNFTTGVLLPCDGGARLVVGR